MKNSKKIDINLEADSISNSNELTEEQRCQQYYETALRYMNIAAYMNQYEDQDKYYNKALTNLKKAKARMPELESLIQDVVHKQYYARAKGKISMYNEACSIRDHAATPTDYFSAQTLFDRIHKYEIKHLLEEKYTPKDLFEEAGKCSDSEQQSVRCGELARQLMVKQRRKSLARSAVFLLIVVFVLAFSRTTSSRLLLAGVYRLTGHYTKAYQSYDYVYQKTNDQEAFKNYEECRYLSAKEGYQTRNREDIRDSFRELSRLNYKDSEQYLVKMEKARIAEMEDGEKIRFGEVNWRILLHDNNRVLLLKDKTQGGVPFNVGGGETDWEHSSVREWLNNTYINVLFTSKLEQDSIIDTSVIPTGSGSKSDASENTTDKLFFLSAEEFAKYADLLPTTHYLWWLRTQGSSPSTMAFVSTDKEIMSYGYETGTDTIRVRPAIWVDVSD